MSQCSKLETHAIPQCSKLETHAITQCSKLETLAVTQCSKLEILAVTQCSKLETHAITQCSRPDTLAITQCSRLETMLLRIISDWKPCCYALFQTILFLVKHKTQWMCAWVCVWDVLHKIYSPAINKTQLADVQLTVWWWALKQPLWKGAISRLWPVWWQTIFTSIRHLLASNSLPLFMLMIKYLQGNGLTINWPSSSSPLSSLLIRPGTRHGKNFSLISSKIAVVFSRATWRLASF